MTATLHFGELTRDGATLGARGRRLAGGLYTLGLREGDVFAVLLRNGPVYADAVHAARIGGIYYCPLNWYFTPPELEYILRDSGARAVIGEGDLLRAAESVLPRVPLLAVDGDGPAGAIAYEPWLVAQPQYDLAAVPPRAHLGYTSGTTGRPKGVRRFPVPLMENHERQAEIAKVTAAAFGIVPGCRALISAPLYHSAPTVFAQHALAVADHHVLAPRFDAEQTPALIARHQVDVIYLVPVMYVRLLRLPETARRAYDVSSVRFVASTGAPCSPEVKQAMIEWFGPVINETYASTESGVVTAITAHEALGRPGSAGRPVGGAIVRILDAEGRPCGPGVVGTVYVCQPAQADFTYHGQPDARRAIERDGLITLGDMGYLDAEGYLYLCDRAADIVVSGGVDIYPAEIEHALLRCAGVLDCAVFGVPDDEFGERLHAVVQPEPGTRLDTLDITARLRLELAAFKIPRSIEVAAVLPRDDNGKISKHRMRAAHWEGRARRI